MFEILLFRTVFQTGQFSTFILEILWILPSFATRALVLEPSFATGNQ